MKEIEALRAVDSVVTLYASLLIAPDDHKPLRRRCFFKVGLYHQSCWKIWVLLSYPFSLWFMHVISYQLCTNLFSSRYIFISPSLTC